LQQDIIDHSGGVLMEVGGISIEHSGPKGALLARGMIKDAVSGYSATVQFSDPQGAKSSKLHGAGLRLGTVGGDRLSPVIVARNIGDASSVLTGQVSYTDGIGSGDNVKIAGVHLQPGEARIVRTPTLSRDIASAGLEFEYSTAPGTVIMSALSVSRDGDQVFRVPLLDPAAQRSSTGGYPWFIEETSSTVVYVKNVTDKPQEYVLELSYAGGSYTLGLEKLQAGQTAAVDVRKLRDNQVADENGRVIPIDATGGQVRWSVRGPQDLVLIGRAEQVDVAKGVISSYACQNCCGDSFDHGSCLPSVIIGLPGDTTQFTAQEYDHNCYGTVGAPFYVSVSSWTSDNNAVATINSSGLATAVDPGSANIIARWTAYVRHLTGFPAYCITDTIFPGASAVCTVARVPRIRSISQSIIDVSQQGGEVVECGRFRVTVRYDVSCPPVEHTLSLIGHITEDADFLCNESFQLITNDNNEVCTYEVKKIYRMRNRLSQETGSAFTSYSAQLTEGGKTVTKEGPGVSVRATISGTVPCQGTPPCP
jgi:hypothetical protein